MKRIIDRGLESRIIAAIKEAEKKTSGEIRVHIQRKLEGDVFEAAKVRFDGLKMYNTRERNGVLIFVALEDRRFAILGDTGINGKVPEGFWDSTVDMMVRRFKKGEIAEGFEDGIRNAGEALKNYFPYHRDDVNELSDNVSNC